MNPYAVVKFEQPFHFGVLGDIDQSAAKVFLQGPAPRLCTGFQEQRPAWLLRAPARRVSAPFLRIPAPNLRVEHLAYGRLAFDHASDVQFLSR
jgi:hypothetical protein